MMDTTAILNNLNAEEDIPLEINDVLADLKELGVQVEDLNKELISINSFYNVSTMQNVANVYYEGKRILTYVINVKDFEKDFEKKLFLQKIYQDDRFIESHKKTGEKIWFKKAKRDLLFLGVDIDMRRRGEEYRVNLGPRGDGFFEVAMYYEINGKIVDVALSYCVPEIDYFLIRDEEMDVMEERIFSMTPDFVNVSFINGFKTWEGYTKNFDLGLGIKFSTFCNIIKQYNVDTEELDKDRLFTAVYDIGKKEEKTKAVVYYDNEKVITCGPEDLRYLDMGYTITPSNIAVSESFVEEFQNWTPVGQDDIIGFAEEYCKGDIMATERFVEEYQKQASIGKNMTEGIKIDPDKISVHFDKHPDLDNGVKAQVSYDSKVIFKATIILEDVDGDGQDVLPQ